MGTLVRVWPRDWAAFSTGFRAWILAVAILTTLTFLGHPAVHVDIPGTDLSVVIPGAGVLGGQVHSNTPAGQPSHEQLCHTSLASCSDIPFASGNPLALMADSLAYLGAAGALVALALLVWHPARTTSVGPELRPPRHGFTVA